ncbi:MAG: hypothetical protein ACOCWT_02685 [Desulfohalobiaceae bacterium]
MSSWPLSLLLAVFVVHFLVFFGLALKRRTTTPILLTGTFVLLIAATSVRLWWPDTQLFGHLLSNWLRAAAWALTIPALALFLRNKLAAKG